MKTPRHITAIDRVSATAFTSSGSSPWESVDFKVPAHLTLSDKIEDGVRIYTAKLVFRACMEPGHTERQVYRCKTADGKYYIIGSGGRPYTITTVTDDHPDNMTDSQLYEVTVNYTTQQKILLYK